ncbi:MAG: transposase [Saprospiraceae bacterium]
MSGYNIENQNSIHFLTMTTVGWIDIFSRQSYRDIIVESMKYCQIEKGLIIYAYVIMSNHIHCIWQTPNGSLSNAVRDFKKFTAAMIIKQSLLEKGESRSDWLRIVMDYHAKFNKNNSNYQLWQNGNRPIELESPKFLYQKLNYIHLNPVRAGIVNEPEHYIYSSASNYLSGKGIIEVSILDLPLSNVGYIAD